MGCLVFSAVTTARALNMMDLLLHVDLSLWTPVFPKHKFVTETFAFDKYGDT